MAKTINSRNTKSEILAAYQAVLKEKNSTEKQNKQLDADLKKVNRELSALKSKSRPATSTPSSTAATTKPTNLTSLEGIIHNLKGIHNSINHAIHKNADLQMVEAETLIDVQNKITKESEQLSALFDIELGEGQLDKLIEDYEETKNSFNEQLKEKKAAFEQELAEKQALFQTEKEEHQLQMKELKEQDTKIRQREKTEHQYNLLQDRTAEEEIYARKKKELHQDLDDIVEQKEAEWKEKETQISAEEKTLADYKKDYEALPEKLSAALKRAEAEGVNIIKRQSKIKMDLLQKEVDAEQKATEMRINALKKAIENQDKTVEKLTAQLENVLQQAQNLAVKAIEGVANASSFDAIRQIALEQAKHTNGKK